MPPRPSRGRVRPREPLPERCCARRPGPVSRFLRPRSPSRRDRGRGVANTETASTTQTTKRVVIEQDIPEPAISGLVEFIDRYYLPSKTRFHRGPFPWQNRERGRLRTVMETQARRTRTSEISASSPQDCQGCHRARFFRPGSGRQNPEESDLENR